MLKNNKVLLASSNQGKIREFKKIFKDFDFISQEDLGIDDAIEDGISFFENALKKARHGSNKSGLLTIGPTKDEKKNKHFIRKSIVAQKNILKGEKFSINNITTKRPEGGISPVKWKKIIGKKSKKNYFVDDFI